MPQLAGANFRKLAETLFAGIPVIIDHNIRSMTSYLLRDIELVDSYDKILFVSARSGNANGFIQNGKLIIGHGEMGHVRVSDEDTQCICGRKGCLDCYFSLAGFTALMPDGADLSRTIEVLTEKYAAGDPRITAELDKRLSLFASALLDVVNVTAPDITVLSGDLFQVYGDPASAVKKIIQQNITGSGYVTHFQNSEIIYREMGTNIASLGICYEMIKNDWGYYREDKRKEIPQS
jgi:predicted NBD/HSP70 family sugar kinase